MKLDEPISNIENRTSQEVFDIMVNRFKSVEPLIANAKDLSEKLQQAETNHGGLMGTDILTSANTLRLELSKWK